MNKPHVPVDAETHAKVMVRQTLMPADIQEMSREQMAVVIEGFTSQVLFIERTYEREVSREGSECPSISRVYSALKHYELLCEAIYGTAMAYDRRDFDQKATRKHVYVAEFDDGNIKIGFSTRPVARIADVAGANQAALLRTWVSLDGLHSPAIERIAHRHFADDRVGGEFFSTSFDVATKWIEAEWLKHQVRGMGT
ncbi:hypothetical protein RCH10_000796 [Variovorax sp. GrIS 2.14]|uniref:GIY-YIG nuclease family protein n=1 Tax=Variovorax sp. GrIS 2.14 TaxID=3071709 RepID=UPI0038F7741D